MSELRAERQAEMHAEALRLKVAREATVKHPQFRSKALLALIFGGACGLALVLTGAAGTVEGIASALTLGFLFLLFRFAWPALLMDDGINASNGGGNDWT